MPAVRGYCGFRFWCIDFQESCGVSNQIKSRVVDERAFLSYAVDFLTVTSWVRLLILLLLLLLVVMPRRRTSIC